MSRRCGLPALVLALMLPALASGTDAVDAGDAAMPAELVAFFDGIDSIEGAFRQIQFDAAGNVVETSEGELAISRPDRFRWRYDSPYEQIIVADGKRLWLYDVDLEQVTVREQGESIRNSPAMLLGGDAAALDAFRFVGTYTDGGQDWLRLEPVQPESDFRGVSLAFADGALLMMELEDPLSQTTRVEFSGLRFNEDLDPALFEFEIPAGVDVVGGEALSRAEPAAAED